MSLIGFSTLYQMADQLSSPVPVVAAGGADRTVLEAMVIAQRRGWISPILVGRVAEIRALAADLDIDLTDFGLVDSIDPAMDAVAEVRAGRALALMKGQIATPELMRAILNRDSGLRTGRSICQVVLMEIPRDKRRFLLSDTGITIQPSLEQKQEILRSLVDVASVLRSESFSDLPRIAVMSATEKSTESMPDTLDAVELARRNREGEISGCVVQGPLSFDLAYAEDAGEKKRIEGEVIGAAEGMLFPNLLSANLTVKAIMYTADCRFGGVLCGTSSPVVFMSRADSTETRLNSLALTVRMVSAANFAVTESPRFC
jgi:phosphate butyryltransferase